MTIWLKNMVEIIAHADLNDMPDTLGANTDHDARYLTLDQTTPQEITNYKDMELFRYNFML